MTPINTVNSIFHTLPPHTMRQPLLLSLLTLSILTTSLLPTFTYGKCVMDHLAGTNTMVATGFTNPEVGVSGNLDSSTGFLDLAFVDYEGGSGLVVITRTGGGGYNTPSVVHTLAGGDAKYLALGDVDNDAAPDIVVAWEAAGQIWLYRNVGHDATFPSMTDLSASASFPPTPEPWGVSVGDIDGDGDMDVVFALRDVGLVGVFVGDNSGTFPSSPVYIFSDSSSFPTTVESHKDLDGDGIADVLLPESGNDILVYLVGTSPLVGSLQRRVIDTVVDFVVAATAGDMDNDGDHDVVAAINADNVVNLYLNNGAGNFSYSVSMAGTLNGPFVVAIADINGDSWNDIIASFPNNNLAAWFPNAGNGVFLPEYPPQDFVDAFTIPYAIVPGDYNNDGRMDVFITGAVSGDAGVVSFLPNPNVYDATRVIVTSSANGAAGVAHADFNGDGWIDLVSASAFDDSIIVYPSNREGSNADSPIVLTSTLDVARDVATGDFDRDGHIDVAAAAVSGTLVWFRNMGKDLWEPDSRVIDPACPGALNVEAGDLSGDGVADVAGACGENPGTGYIRVYINSGDGVTWSLQTLYSATLVANLDLWISDLDNDGDLDISFVAFAPVYSVYWSRNIGPDGAFALSPILVESIPIPGAPLSITTCDVDQDGDEDLVVGLANGVNSEVGVYIASSPGVFASTPTLIAGDYFTPVSVVCGDMNGDTYPDVAVAGFDDNTVSWVPNDGAGTLSGPQYTITTFAVQATEVHLADTTNDGFPDLHIASRGDDTVETHVNRPDPAAVPSDASFPVLPGGVTPTVPEIHYAINTASRCRPQTLELPADLVAGSCMTDDYMQVSFDARWTLKTAPSPPGGANAKLDCAGSGVLWSVAGGGSLTVDGVDLARGSVGAAPEAIAGIRVTGPNGVLSLVNNTVSDFSSEPSSSLQFFSGLGGAISVQSGGRIEGKSVTFSGNTARVSGGAVAVLGTGSSAHFSDTTFVSNTALGGLVGEGGGGAVGILAATGGVVFDQDCVIANNAASPSSGGGLWISGDSDGPVSVSLTDTQIVSNTAEFVGGGLFVEVQSGLDVSVGPGTVLDGNVGGFGGVLGVVRNGYSVPKTVASSYVPRSGGVTPVSPPAVVFESGSSIGSNSAQYGGSVFACGALVDVASAGGARTSSASVGGGAGFVCAEQDGTGVSPEMWVMGASSLVGSADGYGDAFATPVVELAVSVPPSLTGANGGIAAVSGLAFGNGHVVGHDAYGTEAVDPKLVLGVRIAPGSPGIVTGIELGSAFSGVDGRASLASVAVAGALDSVPGTTNVLAELVTTVPSGRASKQVEVSVSLCPPGTGSLQGVARPDLQDKLVCSLCDEGAFSPTESADACIAIPPCPESSLRRAPINDSIVSACECVTGSWSPETTLTSACRACPRGGICAGGTSRPIAAPGFFPDDADPTLFISCPTVDACPGGGGCAQGYEARLCAECSKGYYRLSGKCRKCSSVQQTFIVLLLLFLCLVVTGVLVAFNLSESVNYKFVAAMIGLNALQVCAMYVSIHPLIPPHTHTQHTSLPLKFRFSPSPFFHSLLHFRVHNLFPPLPTPYLRSPFTLP